MKSRGSLAICFAFFVFSEVHAGLITPTSVTGTGSWGNSATYLINGFVPQRNTYFANAGTNVFWYDTATYFTIDLGALYSVQQLAISVDNNDGYLIQYSTNGTTFTNLFQFLASDGPVTALQGGTDTLTTDSTYPTNPGNLFTPAYVGRSFTAVDARYLRFSANGGDGYYGAGEVSAYGVLVPVPAGFILFSSSIILLAGLSCYRKRTLSIAI